MNLHRARIAVLALLLLIAWLVAASAIMLAMTGHIREFGLWWWWDGLAYIAMPGVATLLVKSGTGAAILVAVLAGAALSSRADLFKKERPNDTLYGRTEWASRGELHKGGFREKTKP